jgi:transketolase
MNSEQLARAIRVKSLQLVCQANASHIGGALSMADLLAVLYTDILNVTPNRERDPERDRLLLSKGHCCVALYSVLALKGFFPLSELDSYGRDGSRFLSHSSHYLPGVEVSSGSLGHGLPIACGIALAAKRQHKSYKIYCIVGDGEMDEGSNWEALLFAAHHNLSNLCLIIDCNKLQSLGSTSEVLNLESLQKKLNAFNWHSVEVDGHDHFDVRNALVNFGISSRPMALIAHTVKGRGVGFMENQLLWHYKTPDPIQYEQALNDINAA